MLKQSKFVCGCSETHAIATRNQQRSWNFSPHFCTLLAWDRLKYALMPCSMRPVETDLSCYNNAFVSGRNPCQGFQLLRFPEHCSFPGRVRIIRTIFPIPLPTCPSGQRVQVSLAHLLLLEFHFYLWKGVNKQPGVLNENKQAPPMLHFLSTDPWQKFALQKLCLMFTIYSLQ